MARLNKLLTQIESFEPPNGEWIELELILEKLWKTGSPEKGIPQMLSIFERFPEDNGNGVFWSIVHGLESLDSYESELISSMRHQPSDLGLTMVRRIENSGQSRIAALDIQEFYKELLGHPKLLSSTKEELLKYVK